MQEKSNDLFCFSQSVDLKSIENGNLCNVNAFLKILESEVKPALQQLTGLDLSGEISISVSKYDCSG